MKKLFFRLPENMSPQARSAFLFATILTVAHIAAMPYYLYLGSTTQVYQFFILGGITFLLGLFLAVGAVLSWRERHTQGILLALGSMAVFYPLFATMVTGLGLVLGIAMTIVGTMTALQVLPRKSGQLMAGVAILSGLTTVVLDANGPTTRPTLQGIFIQLLVLAVIGLLGVFLVSEFPRVRTSVSYKLISVVIMVLIINAGFQIVYSNGATRNSLEKESRDTLVGYYHTYESKIRTESLSAEALALSVANRSDVQAHYQSKDRDGLYKLLSPLFTEWKHREIVHLYVENPNGTVFLRVHSPEKFDDDITYRGTADTALKEKRPTSGVEIGPSRIGVRGVAPMYSSSGQFIGLTEVGMDFDEKFISDLKDYTGADYTMWVLQDAAAVANLQPVEDAPAAPIDELFYYASSSSESLPINADDYRSVLKTGEPVFRVVTQNTKTPSIVYITPLLGYGDKVIGLLQISDSYAGHLADQRSAFLTTLAVTAALTILGLLLIALFSSRAVIQPLNALSNFAARQMNGETGSRVSVVSGDEFQQLAETFNLLANSVEQERRNLEQRVAERTHSLELAGEVGRSVSQVHALDVMLRDAAELIRSRFDLYYVQVYLTNPAQSILLLESGTGMVGEELVSRGHRLPIDSGSINGRAVVEKRSVVISATTSSATFRPNPLLPDTQSEMAVPLMVGEVVVGVLDLQSEKPGALSQDMLPAFEALAGQLAIAIQNANLLAEAEHARAEVESQARRLVHKNWEDYLDAIHTPEQIGFVFEDSKVMPLSELTDFQPAAEGSSIQTPIAITGELLGSLIVEMDAQELNPQNAELVNIIARQVAQQIENLRLLESTERYRSEAEQAARRLTAEGWQEYVKSRSISNLGYLYDLNEVRPSGNGNETNEPAFTLPLKARDETIGKLSINGLTSDDKDSFELVNAVAERLGAHIDSLRQHEQTQSALAQSEKLFDASRRLTQATDLQSLVKVTVESLGIAEIDRAILGVLHYDSEGVLEGMAIAANWSGTTGLQATPVGTRYPKEALRAMSLFMGPEPLFFDDMLNDERVDEGMQEIPRRLHYRSVAALPLFIGSRQDAMLLLEGEQPHSFTTEEIRLFTALAPQLATVLENRQQYEKAQHQAEREAMLNLINQKIQSATTVDAVLQIAARELGSALGAPLTIAQLGLKNRSNGN